MLKMVQRGLASWTYLVRLLLVLLGALAVLTLPRPSPPPAAMLSSPALLLLKLLQLPRPIRPPSFRGPHRSGDPAGW